MTYIAPAMTTSPMYGGQAFQNTPAGMTHLSGVQQPQMHGVIPTMSVLSPGNMVGARMQFPARRPPVQVECATIMPIKQDVKTTKKKDKKRAGSTPSSSPHSQPSSQHSVQGGSPLLQAISRKSSEECYTQQKPLITQINRGSGIITPVGQSSQGKTLKKGLLTVKGLARPTPQSSHRTSPEQHDLHSCSSAAPLSPFFMDEDMHTPTDNNPSDIAQPDDLPPLMDGYDDDLM